MNAPNPLLTPAEAAALLNVSEKHLRSLTADGAIKYLNVGRGSQRERRRYTLADIEQFVEARRCQPTSGPATRPTARSSSFRILDFQDIRDERLKAKQSRHARGKKPRRNSP